MVKPSGPKRSATITLPVQVGVMQELLAGTDLSRSLDTLVPDIDGGRGVGILWLCGPRVLIQLCTALASWLREAPRPTAVERDSGQRCFDEIRAARLREIHSAPSDATRVHQWLRRVALAVHDRCSLASFVEAVLDQRSALACTAATPLIQFVGTCNPFHVGHRLAMAGARNSLGVDDAVASAAMLVASREKPDMRLTYRARVVSAERRIQLTRLLPNGCAGVLDIAPGVSLGGDTVALGSTVARVAEDSRIRWLYGSDKLLVDHRAFYASPSSSSNAHRRFRDPTLECVVWMRPGDNSERVAACIQELENDNNCACAFNVIDNVSSDTPYFSSSAIRAAYASQDAKSIGDAELLDVGDLDVVGVPEELYALQS